MENRPDIPAPANAELVRVALGSWADDDQFSARVRFDDGAEIELQLPRESPELEQLLELLSTMLTRALSRVGQSGVVLTGIAPPELFDVDEEER